MRDVGAPQEPPAAADGARSWPLLITSTLMLLAVFGIANPAFGVTERAWPWEAFVGGRATPRVTTLVALWSAAALWGLLLSPAGPRRLRALGAVALAALLTIECPFGLAPVAVFSMGAGALAALIALGAGLWLARTPGRPGARTLAGVGAFLALWIAGTAFESSEGGESVLAGYVAQMEALVRDVDGTSALPEYLWDTLLPRTLVFVAAGFGLLVSFGARMPRTSRVMFFLLLAALLVPGVVEAFAERRSAADAPEQASVSTGVFEKLLLELIQRGVLLWAFAVFALADLAAARPGIHARGEVDA